jgi:chromosomal replication initiation ATPase DnaA
MEDIIIREINNEENNYRIAIFTYNGDGNPKTHLDNAIRIYANDEGYNQYIDSHLDNPFTRVVIIGLNNIPQEDYAERN